MKLEEAKLLAGIPEKLRATLLQNYRDIASNYAARRWAPSELDGGKFSESAYTILHGALTGAYAAAATKPKNMVDACKQLENLPATIGGRSFKILIPRLLPALYEIRNNRGVGHVGGDVDPNLMDATAVFNMASWILSELIRVFHNMTTAQASEIVASLVERKTPMIWELEGVKRVLDARLSARDQTLLLLHQVPGWLRSTDLASWTEYSGHAMYVTRVLAPLHKERLIEHDKKGQRAHLSPKGAADVETRLIKLPA